MTYHHIYKPGSSQNKRVFLLLHGTGGSETDLLPLADFLDPQASVLSVRGDVSENGMNRFFRRLAEGVFDLEDLTARTKALLSFVAEVSKEYDFDQSEIVSIGYSNGANMAASMLYFESLPVRGAALLHPMIPFKEKNMLPQKGLPVFVGAGTNDPICVPAETNALLHELEEAGAKVSSYWGASGHSLTQEEMVAMKRWYTTKITDRNEGSSNG